MKEYFTVEDMQELFNISKVEIANLSNGGMLPHGKMRGGKRTWTFGEVLSWSLERSKNNHGNVEV